MTGYCTHCSSGKHQTWITFLTYKVHPVAFSHGPAIGCLLLHRKIGLVIMQLQQIRMNIALKQFSMWLSHFLKFMWSFKRFAYIQSVWKFKTMVYMYGFTTHCYPDSCESNQDSHHDSNVDVIQRKHLITFFAILFWWRIWNGSVHVWSMYWQSLGIFQLIINWY